MSYAITPFLMFERQAEDALQLYLNTFDDSELIVLEHYGLDDEATDGLVKMARLRLGELQIICMDSPIPHDFNFTPSMSLYVECDDESQLRSLAEQLQQGGSFLMPVGQYGFSTLYCWLKDRFGVSWQLNLR